MTNEPTTTVTVRIPDRLLSRVDTLCAADRFRPTRSAAIRHMIEEWLRSDLEEDPRRRKRVMVKN